MYITILATTLYIASLNWLVSSLIALSAIHTLLALLNRPFKLSAKLTARAGAGVGVVGEGERTKKYLKHLPLILSFAVNCSPPHTQRERDTRRYSPVYNFIWVFGSCFYTLLPCYPAHPQQVSLAQQVSFSVSLSLSRSLCVTCAAIWPGIMSSVRYLVPV